MTLTSKRAKGVSRNMNMTAWIIRVQREEILEKQVEKKRATSSAKRKIEMLEDFITDSLNDDMHLCYIVLKTP